MALVHYNDNTARLVAQWMAAPNLGPLEGSPTRTAMQVASHVQFETAQLQLQIESSLLTLTCATVPYLGETLANLARGCAGTSWTVAGGSRWQIQLFHGDAAMTRRHDWWCRMRVKARHPNYLHRQYPRCHSVPCGSTHVESSCSLGLGPPLE